MTSRWLSPSEDKVWRSYRRMVTLLEATLSRELAEETGLSMADYTVLSNLVEAKGRRWRVTTLADYVQWSQSRLSHQIKRMEGRGLVEREQVADDARGAQVVLTRKGLEAIAAATPTHLTGVQRHFVDVLSPEELERLGEIVQQLLVHLTSGPATDH